MTWQRVYYYLGKAAGGATRQSVKAAGEYVHPRSTRSLSVLVFQGERRRPVVVRTVRHRYVHSQPCCL